MIDESETGRVPQLQLILGGARSGKSRLALQVAESTGLQHTFLATATAEDGEMCARIENHQAERGSEWKLLEEPLNLAAALASLNHKDCCVLVDCTTLWISNCLQAGNWETQRDALFELLPKLSCKVIFVSNETGLGIVPLGELTRQFVDASGFFNQRLAAVCDAVTMVVAGIPVQLKAN